jgi:hypothetical protein
MPQTLSSTKPINNNSSIGFANDNFCGSFCTFSPNYFLNYFPSSDFENSQISALKASTPVFNNFKNNPSSALNASSLFSSKLRFDSKSDSRQPLRRLTAPEGVLAKNAVRIFLTLKPIAKNADGSLKTNDNGTFETVSGIGGLGGSVGNNGAQANIGMGEGESSLDQTTFTNSQLVAKSGTLKVISRNANI